MRLKDYDFSHFRTWRGPFAYFVMEACMKPPRTVRLRWPVWNIWQWSLDAMDQDEKSFEERYAEKEGNPAAQLGMLLGRSMAKAHLQALEKQVEEELCD